MMLALVNSFFLFSKIVIWVRQKIFQKLIQIVGWRMLRAGLWSFVGDHTVYCGVVVVAATIVVVRVIARVPKAIA